MAIELRDCDFFGPALPEPFVKFELERHLNKHGLLPRTAGAEGQALQREWEPLYRKLRELAFRGGEVRVRNNVLEPLIDRLGYSRMVRAETVRTREGDEDAGWLMENADSSQQLRVWSVGLGTDMDAPNRRGRQYRFSPSRIAQRVMLAQGERIGLLTDGEELRMLLCDPARPDSQIVIRLDKASGWRGFRSVPDSYRLLKALASPAGVAALPKLTEEARLNQTTVTKKLRQQARSAVEGFIQELIDHPANRETRASWTDLAVTSHELWREGLILVYRLLFIFKLESSADPARAFSFAATSLWRNSYSPNIALATYVRKVLDDGIDTGNFLEESLRTVFRIFAEGLSSSELRVAPLGGALFGPETTPLFNDMAWGEQAVAKLLDRLLWTSGDGHTVRERVHYGSLDVEDLGRVYEALLELEPGISTEPMCRLRRAKLEVVVPLAQGASYRANAATEEQDDEDVGDDAEEETPSRGKTQVQWVEEIPAGRYYLRVGLGRKASGSYYTPHPFVRFLVQETLGPQVQERSPAEDPQPGEILKLKVLDPAMGSGHFLVEACRYLGDALYEACRLCDERALEAEEHAETAEDAAREALLARAAALRQRVEDLPDPNDELVAYLPSRVPEGLESGHSQRKAEAICRRLVAVHCLYGVDKNELAVELAKLSLWLESYAEGLPLTFLDHRLVCGDSLTGPFFENLLTYPRSGERLQGLFADGLAEQLQKKLTQALVFIQELEASVGKDVADLELKRLAKANLDESLSPFKLLASVWSGGVMLQDKASDSDYELLAHAVIEGEMVDAYFSDHPRLVEMVKAGQEGIAFDLVFPEVFYGIGTNTIRSGFNSVVGNPPWDAIQPHAKEFFAAFDLRIINAPTRRERSAVEKELLSVPELQAAYSQYLSEFTAVKAVIDRLYRFVGLQAGGRPSGAITDSWQAFAERASTLLCQQGHVGWVLPSAFHANQSATGIRELYLKKLSMSDCYSFENRKRLFEIHLSFKFAAIVARNENKPSVVECAFYLHDLDWLFSRRQSLKYTTDFIHRTGGEYYTFLELKNDMDLKLANTMTLNSTPMGELLQSVNIKCGVEIDMSKGSGLFTPVATLTSNDPRTPQVLAQMIDSGYLMLHEGKTFHQFQDNWGERPRYLVELSAIADKHEWLTACCHYRIAYRAIARSTDERTSIFCILPPGVVFGNSSPAERKPSERPVASALIVVAVANTFCFDWILRQKTSANVNIFIINGCSFPKLSSAQKRFLAHAALRLTCNHQGYNDLWKDQLGEVWRETAPQKTWPILDNDKQRFAVRFCIDAVVADAYGLLRDQYEYLLTTFSHRTNPQAPEKCLLAFDELKAIGICDFCRKYDPYSDISLNESLPQSVINLPIPGEQKPTSGLGRASNKSGQFTLFEESPGPLFDAIENPDKNH